MSYVVITTANAEAEFQEQYAYIAARSESGAESWAGSFREALDQLSRIPTVCTKAPESAGRDEDIRQYLFKTRHGRPYRLLFLIRDEAVYILHIRGPRQNLMQADEIVTPEE